MTDIATAILTINGLTRAVSSPATTTPMDALRDHLHLTGVKDGWISVHRPKRNAMRRLHGSRITHHPKSTTMFDDCANAPRQLRTGAAIQASE